MADARGESPPSHREASTPDGTCGGSGEGIARATGRGLVLDGPGANIPEALERVDGGGEEPGLLSGHPAGAGAGSAPGQETSQEGSAAAGGTEGGDSISPASRPRGPGVRPEGAGPDIGGDGSPQKGHLLEAGPEPKPVGLTPDFEDCQSGGGSVADGAAAAAGILFEGSESHGTVPTAGAAGAAAPAAVTAAPAAAAAAAPDEPSEGVPVPGFPPREGDPTRRRLWREMAEPGAGWWGARRRIPDPPRPGSASGSGSENGGGGSTTSGFSTLSGTRTAGSSRTGTFSTPSSGLGSVATSISDLSLTALHAAKLRWVSITLL